MNIDTHLDLNTLIAVLGMAGSIFYFVARMNSDIKAVVMELASVKGEVKAISGLLVESARQGERLNAMDVRANIFRSDMDAINERLTTLERRHANGSNGIHRKRARCILMKIVVATHSATAANS